MSRTTTLVVGILLVLLGGAGLAVEGVTWNDQEQIVDVGPLEASATVERETRIPPLAAGGALLLGLGLTVWGATRSH